MCTISINRGHRSVLAQFRSGILPLQIETGRYPVEFRICLMCDENVCENEIHFMFSCKFYQDLQANLYENVIPIYQHFLELADFDKLQILIENNAVKHKAGCIWLAYKKPKKDMYTFI